MFTAAQIFAIVMLLQAFGVDAATINQVQLALAPAPINQPVQQDSTQNAPSQQSVQNSPVEPVFGATDPIQTPVVIPWTIKVDVSSSTPQALTGMSRLRVNVYDPNGTYQKVPVTVSTNDPDLPTTFQFNAQPSPINFFCVAPVYPDFPNNGCLNENPVSVGTFDFTFSAEGVSTTVPITVNP